MKLRLSEFGGVSKEILVKTLPNTEKQFLSIYIDETRVQFPIHKSIPWNFLNVFTAREMCLPSKKNLMKIYLLPGTQRYKRVAWEFFGVRVDWFVFDFTRLSPMDTCDKREAVRIIIISYCFLYHRSVQFCWLFVKMFENIFPDVKLLNPRLFLTEFSHLLSFHFSICPNILICTICF